MVGQHAVMYARIDRVPRYERCVEIYSIFRAARSSHEVKRLDLDSPAILRLRIRISEEMYDL
jgi:hypothetical protein